MVTPTLGIKSTKYRLIRPAPPWQPLFETGSLVVNMSAKEAADIKEQQIAAAKARAASRPRGKSEVKEIEWEAITLEDAVTLMEMFTWEGYAKYGFGLSSDGQSIMARVACPKDSGISDYAGMVGFSFGSSLDHAIRKIAQMHNGDYDAWWKKDGFAK